MQSSRIAFALGGLAGNNAHGAGVLQAARVCQVKPCLISCTSGQIYWTYQYLLARKDLSLDLRGVLKENIEKVTPTKNVNLDTAILALRGNPGAIGMDYTDYLQDFCRNSLESFMHIMTRGTKAFWLEEGANAFPARTMIQEYSKNFFKAISIEFNHSDIGIIFNSYNPVEGIEYVHLNPVARARLTENTNEDHYARGQGRHAHRPRTVYQDITLDAVRDALWVYQYGFDHKETSFLDGAYFRQIILNELTYANKIYVARPINHKWIGALPLNYPGMEDMKVEVNFNGTYQGERNQIKLVNKLIKDKALSDPKYHEIELEEIEIKHQRGYFGYMEESLDVFDDAYVKALELFQSSMIHNAKKMAIIMMMIDDD